MDIITETAVEYKLSVQKREFKREKITSSEDAVKYIRQFYFDDIDIFESCFALFLNGDNQTIGYAKISQGGTTSTVVDIQIVCKYAIECLAKSVILAHNHPSGSTRPSENDKDLTRKTNLALGYFGVKLFDHIILTSDNFLSFSDQGMMF